MQRSKQFQQRDKAQIAAMANRHHTRGNNSQASNLEKANGKFINKMQSPDVNVLKAQRRGALTNEGLNSVQFPLINGVPANQLVLKNSVIKNKQNIEKHAQRRLNYQRDTSSGNENSLERVIQPKPRFKQVQNKQIQQQLANLIEDKIDNFQDYQKKSGLIQRCTSQMSNQVINKQTKLGHQSSMIEQGSLESNKQRKRFNQFSTQIQVTNPNNVNELSPPKGSLNIIKRQTGISKTSQVPSAQIFKQSGRFPQKSEVQRKLEYNTHKASSIYLSKSPYRQSVKMVGKYLTNGKSYSPDRGHKQLVFNNFDQIKKQQQSILRRESLIDQRVSIVQHVTSQIGLCRDNRENIQYQEFSNHMFAQTEQTYRDSVSPKASKISQNIKMNLVTQPPRKSRNLNRGTATQESPSKMNSLTGSLATFTQQQVQGRLSINQASDLKQARNEISPYMVSNQQISSPKKHISTSYKTYDAVMKLLDNKSVTKQFFDRYGPNIANKMKKSEDGQDLATMIAQNQNTVIDQKIFGNKDHIKQAAKHLKNKQVIKRKRLNNGNHSVKNPEQDKKGTKKKVNQRHKNQVSLDKYFGNGNKEDVCSPNLKQLSMMRKEKVINETMMQNYRPVDLNSSSKQHSTTKIHIGQGVDANAHSNEFEVNINNQSGLESSRHQLKVGQDNISKQVIFNEYYDIMKVHSTHLSQNPSNGSMSVAQLQEEQSRMSGDQSSLGYSTNQALQVLAPDACTKQEKRQFKRKYQEIKGMKRALMKAKALGYIGYHQMKNKDTAAWTQPKDPLQIKMEVLGQRSNIYDEELFNHEFESIEESFISKFDRDFVDNYSDEAFRDMVMAEIRDGTCDNFMENQTLIGRQLRIKVIDWLYEVIKKFKITDRSIMFQTVELMDKFFICSKIQHPSSELQMIAVTCFFIAAKNIMIDPFTLQNAIEHMCYGKYSQDQFLQKERDIRLTSQYINEVSNHMDFASLFLKIIKNQFCKRLSEKKKYPATRISTVTISFFKEIDMLSYEFCKLALCDPFTKRYLRSYVAASIVIQSFEIMVEKVQNDSSKSMKIDISHIEEIYKVMQKSLTRLFGYNKYVFFQFLGKFLINRFRIFFYQYSGLLIQQKHMLHQGKEINQKNDYKIALEFSENYMHYIFKEKVNYHLYDLYDLSQSIRSDSFYRHFIPEIHQAPIEWNTQIDFLLIQNDLKFHDFLERQLLQADHKYFKQFQELQSEFQRHTQACAHDNISLNSKDWDYIDQNSIEQSSNESHQMIKFRNGNQVITIQEPQADQPEVNNDISDWFVSVKNAPQSKSSSNKKHEMSQMKRNARGLAKDSSNPSMFRDIPQTITQDLREQDSAIKKHELEQRFKDKSADVSFEEIKTFEENNREPHQKPQQKIRTIMPHGGIPPNISMSPTRTRNQLVHSKAVPQIAVSLAQNSKFSLGTTDFKLSSIGKNTETMYINQEPFNNDSHSNRFDTNVSLRKQDKMILQNLNSNSEKNLCGLKLNDYAEQQHLDKILENQIEENARSTFNTRNHPLKQSQDQQPPHDLKQEPELSKETSYSNFYDPEGQIIESNKIIEVEGEEDLSSKPVSPKYHKRPQFIPEQPQKLIKSKIVGNNGNRVNFVLNGQKTQSKNPVNVTFGGKKVTVLHSGHQVNNKALEF